MGMAEKVGGMLAGKEKMQVSSMSTIERLYRVLFPGKNLDKDKYADFANELRRIADQISGEHVVEHMSKKRALERPGKKDVDFSRYRKRQIALEILYRGFDYHGFARQEGIGRTIEEELFHAFQKTRLVPVGITWQEMKYSRGGRTDKGVSGAGQVVALEVRSRGLTSGDPLPENEEFDYPAILNRVLPTDIRVLGWRTVSDEFSARFCAQYREYKYFFPNCDNSLQIEAMRQAVNYLVGEHDFRNFCKADVPTVKSFERRILSADIKQNESVKLENCSVLELHIQGSAFLWHQIRCIAAVLLMVGQGLEPPSIVKKLLDIHIVSQKPQYLLASEEPLLLYDCVYQDLNFIRSQNVYNLVSKEISSEISSLLSRISLILAMKSKIDAHFGSDCCQKAKELELNTVQSSHVPLLSRAREPSIEERLRRYEEKTK